MVKKFPSRWFDDNEASAQRSGQRWNINPRVVEAMIMVETGGNAGLIGDSGRSAGIIHIMDITARYINQRHPGGHLDRLVPADAIEMGCWYLRHMDTQYNSGDNYLKMTRGYNAGQYSWGSGFTLNYPAYVAAYLAMRVEDTANNPAKAEDHAQYKEALDAMLEDADELGRGREFRGMVAARIRADGRTLRGYGRDYYNRRPDENGKSWPDFREGALSWLGSSGDARAPRREETQPDVPALPEDLVQRAETLEGERGPSAAHTAIIRDRALVRAIQTAMGFTGDAVDGRWGGQTQTAYEAFEASRDGFTADGKVSADEVARILAPNPLQEGIIADHRAITRDPELVKKIQRAIGLTGRDVDGDWGPKTQRAYEAYERNTVGLTPDGRVSHEELSQMLAPPTPPAPAPAPTPGQRTEAPVSITRLF